ncbi:MAG: malto-oligosyltrehalose synthase, partial [Ilumatobacteraceae bacterium]
AVDPARGGDEGLRALSATARRLGLGVLVDLVPNHVGVATPMDSVWWRDLLTHGPTSRYAEAFDVDWAFGHGKVRIPVLGDEARPVLSVDGGALTYHEHRFPLAPGSADDGAAPDVVHQRQHYELVNWRRADADLNYRRFFAVTTLAGIRVEVPWVFAESHAAIVGWVTDGLVDGLRVDHPDGLADPGGYLDLLAEATGGAYVLVEKILLGAEQLPNHWATAGTTGYDALADIDRVLVDPAGQPGLDALDSRLHGVTGIVSWAAMIHDTKRGIADGILRSEVLRVERDLGLTVAEVVADESRPISPTADAVAELLACFPVYRSYLPLGREHLDGAVELATAHRPELTATILDVAEALADPTHPAAIRFQQTSGMVMAKGVEDCAFYRYNRLGSLTEVGADPAEFSIDVAELHRRHQRRQAAAPATMTTLSTHDTKRGEDVRARLDVLTEIPDQWADALDRLHDAVPIGDRPLEQLLWQAIIGAWPASRDRLHAYAEKASREAGMSTTWTAPDPEFEAAMHALVDRAFDDEHVGEILAGLLDTIRVPGWSNSLAAKLIQLTAPGVPDVYQGSELWETSLVDPDNRRPVDFDLRRRLLATIGTGPIPAVDEVGTAKLVVTSRALRARRDRPELFTAYKPVATVGPAALHAVAFDRGGAITVATRLPIGLQARGGWADTEILVPSRPTVDVMTGRRVAGGRIPLGDLLADAPVALLVPDRDTDPRGRS